MTTQDARSSILPWIIVCLTFMFGVGSCTLLSWYGMSKSFEAVGFFDDDKKTHHKFSEEKIAQLEIDGVIMGGREDIFDSLDEIDEHVKDKKIKALVIHINSPGGSVAPTQEIYARINEIKKTVPVICSMADVAASGGYYLASTCEEIFALPGTTTGSIGVIFQFFNAQDLVTWAKLKAVTVKAGKLKDVGSPFRAMKDEEMAYLQDMVDSVHEQFIRDVLLGRAKKITEPDLRAIADGRILTGEQAQKLGLVDKLGGLHEAIAWLRTNKKIDEEIEVIRFPRPKKSLDALFSSKAPLSFEQSVTQWGLERIRPYNGIVPMLLPPTMGISP